MLTWIIIILLVLWLLGFFGPRFIPSIHTGNWIHALIVIVVILVGLKLLRIV
jgi:hypothetical protein